MSSLLKFATAAVIGVAMISAVEDNAKGASERPHLPQMKNDEYRLNEQAHITDMQMDRLLGWANALERLTGSNSFLRPTIESIRAEAQKLQEGRRQLEQIPESFHDTP